MNYTFKAILSEKGWLENTTISLDEKGNITQISAEENPASEKIEGYVLPGFQNAHSHAFQYAMAGLAESFEEAENPDNFWSWRDAMYKIALSVSPDDLENIATMLYAEMLRHGYTSVAEFHYLHHDQNGKPYNNISELGERLLAAAKKTGIRITLVPVFYKNGNFGTKPNELQRRFICGSFDEYFQLVEATKDSIKQYSNAKLGKGVHSLRAVSKDDLLKTVEYSERFPFHMHIAEQLKEVDDCKKFYGKRPVEWLFENVSVTENFNLIHGTHLENREIENIATSGANVVLCPSTEGNLGDGRFHFKEYQNLDGKWSIGTDSQICLNPFEDFRMLDYSQRINTHQRNIFAQKNSGESGFNAIKESVLTGRKAMGNNSTTFFEIGQPFDAVIVDANIPLIENTSLKNLCNTLVYSSDPTFLLGTIVGGKWMVKNGHHINSEEIKRKFRETFKNLKIR